MSVDNPGLVVTRWRRYGKDRIYVATADGEQLGYWDLVADRGHSSTAAHEPALLSAVAAWRAEHPDAGLAAVAVTTPADQPEQPAAAATAPLDQPSRAAADPEPAGSMEPGADPEPVIDDVIPVGEADAAEPVPTWTDLAANLAGAEVRKQALAAREAAPVKTVLARILRVHTDERAWRIGADGEEKVAAQLAKVAKKDPRWRFLHAIPVGERGSDIDHLVIGPAGVFTVNSKHHPRANIWVGGNTLMVNGTRQPYIRNSRHEAARAAKLLTATCGFPVHVEGLIVTVRAEKVTIKEQPEGVHVVERINLARWLRRRRGDHEPETLDAIFEAARRSTTWRP
jgi:hypothetical protein